MQQALALEVLRVAEAVCVDHAALEVGEPFRGGTCVEINQWPMQQTVLAFPAMTRRVLARSSGDETTCGITRPLKSASHDSARTRRKILISTQGGTQLGTEKWPLQQTTLWK